MPTAAAADAAILAWVDSPTVSSWAVVIPPPPLVLGLNNTLVFS